MENEKHLTSEDIILNELAISKEENKILKEKLEITQAVVDEIALGGTV